MIIWGIVYCSKDETVNTAKATTDTAATDTAIDTGTGSSLSDPQFIPTFPSGDEVPSVLSSPTINVLYEIHEILFYDLFSKHTLLIEIVFYTGVISIGLLALIISIWLYYRNAIQQLKHE